MLAQARTDIAPVRARIEHRACDRLELVAAFCLPGVRRSGVVVTADGGTTKGTTVRVTGPIAATGQWMVQEIDLPPERAWGHPVVAVGDDHEPVVIRIPLVAGED